MWNEIFKTFYSIIGHSAWSFQCNTEEMAKINMKTVQSESTKVDTDLLCFDYINQALYSSDLAERWWISRSFRQWKLNDIVGNVWKHQKSSWLSILRDNFKQTSWQVRVVHGYAQLVGQAPQTVYEMQRGIFLKNVKQKSPWRWALTLQCSWGCAVTIIHTDLEIKITLAHLDQI